MFFWMPVTFCVFGAVLGDCFWGHFVMVLLSLTILHCLQHFFSQYLKIIIIFNNQQDYLLHILIFKTQTLFAWYMFWYAYHKSKRKILNSTNVSRGTPFSWFCFAFIISFHTVLLILHDRTFVDRESLLKNRFISNFSNRKVNNDVFKWRELSYNDILKLICCLDAITKKIKKPGIAEGIQQTYGNSVCVWVKKKVKAFSY